ncbi:hypothetical protein IAQ61_008193, partial [Plenodomus lingam]|uniref:uncharacterized protein n=1 Tax=Leptosphaeria maculans TaxID=5022 RepID=UPI003323AF5A
PTLTTTSDICDRHGPGSPSDTHNRYGRNCVFLSMSASHGSRKSVHRGPLVPQLSFGPAPACHSRPHRPSSPGTSSAHGPLCCYRSANVALPCSSLAHHVSPVVQQSAIARGMPASIRYASLGSPMSRLMSSNPLQGSQSTKQMAESAFCFSPKCSLHCVAPSPHALIPMDPPVSFNSHLPRHLLNRTIILLRSLNASRLARPSGPRLTPATTLNAPSFLVSIPLYHLIAAASSSSTRRPID